MSYILEALKKSEQERLRGAPPTLHAANLESFREPTRPVGRYVLAAVLLGAMGVAAWWLPRPPGTAVQAPAPVAAPTRGPAVPVPPGAQATVAAETARAPIQTQAKGGPVAEAPVVKDPTPTVNPPPPAQPKPKTLPRAGREQDILEFSELPAAVQRALPKLSVSGYVNYAGDPTARMVALGDQLVREGEEVRAGLRLEQIRPDEVIFGYKGYRFRLRAP